MERDRRRPAQPAGRRFVRRMSGRRRDLRWNLAGAVARLALSALLVVRGSRCEGRAGSQASTPVVAVPPAAALPSTVLVRLVVLQPGARTVQAAGDFNGWNPASTSLEQISSGAWTVTIPLEPGRYEYSVRRRRPAVDRRPIRRRAERRWVSDRATRCSR